MVPLLSGQTHDRMRAETLTACDHAGGRNMATKLTVAVAATTLVLGFAGAAKAGEGSVDSADFGWNRYNNWNQTYAPIYPWGGMVPGYSYAPRGYYDDDSMTGYAVRRPMVDQEGYDDDADE
jgi:hypothetical protein